jgi:hypothetical protein
VIRIKEKDQVDDIEFFRGARTVLRKVARLGTVMDEELCLSMADWEDLLWSYQMKMEGGE